MVKRIIVGIGMAVWLSAGPGLAADPKAPTPEATQPALDQTAMAELAREHSRARDALMAAEARMSLLMEQVFQSRLVVRYRGDLDRGFELKVIELDLDGALAYRKEFEKATSIQDLKLFDGFLPPGRHVLQLRIYAKGSDDPPGTLPGYFAGSGMAVHLREKAVCRASFVAEQDGDSPGRTVVKEEEPEGSWEVEIEGSFQVEAN